MLGFQRNIDVANLTKKKPGVQPTPGHNEWFSGKVRKALAKKARGESNYTPLSEVRKEFGL